MSKFFCDVVFLPAKSQMISVWKLIVPLSLVLNLFRSFIPPPKKIVPLLYFDSYFKDKKLVNNCLIKSFDIFRQTTKSDMKISMSQFVIVWLLAIIQPLTNLLFCNVQFLAAFAIVHLLRSMFFFRTISIVCRLKNFIQLFFYYSFDTANTRTATFFFNNFEAYQISSIVSMWTTANFFGNIANRINFNTLTIFISKWTFRT